MTKNKLIHLSDSEKGWLIIGICLGIILTMVFLYLYTYLPSITPTQQATLSGFIGGSTLVWLLQKIEWGDSENE